MLVKIFNFKGIFQAGRKMDTPLGYFRRFTNSYKDKSGRIWPSGKTLLGGNTPHHPQNGNTAGGYPTIVYRAPRFSQVFNNKIFQMMPSDPATSSNNYRVEAFRYGQKTASEEFTQIQNGTVGASFRGLLADYNSSYFHPQGEYSSAVVNNKLFFCQYVDFKKYSDAAIAALPSASLKEVKSTLLKFDGLKVCRAGLPTPWRHYNPVASGANARLRYFYMSMGPDAEPVFSDYIELQVTTTDSLDGLGNSFKSVPKFIRGLYDTGAVETTELVGNAGVVYPLVRHPGDSLKEVSSYTNYARGALRIDGAFTPTVVNGTGITIGTLSNEEQEISGDWYTFIVNNLTIGGAYDAFSMQLTGYAGGALNRPIFANKIKGYNGFTNTWEDIDLEVAPPQGYAMSDFIGYLQNAGALSNIFIITCVSLNADGSLPYELCDISPVPWAHEYVTTTKSVSPVIYKRPRFGIITRYMADWYEATIPKIMFPPTIKGITSYSNLLIGYDDNFLYFSETSYGGSTEMTSGTANLFVPGSEFGVITAACGAENFMLVSRERKNYVLSGELTTGNVTYNECDVAIPGAENARATSNAFADQVVFMNKTGIYSVGQSGAITELSKDIRDLFLGVSEDGNLFDTGIFKGTKPSFDGAIYKIILDEARGFILILTGQRDQATMAVTNANILVFDTNDGSWYEWTTPSNCSSIEFVDGKIHFLCDSEIYVEGETSSSQVLTFGWATMGEPSLEKQVTQLKLFAKVADGTPILIKQQNDWEAGLVTDTTLTPDSTKYIHKKRLTSSKALSTSVSLEGQTNGIYLEGIELEMEGIQDGMKK